MAGELAIAPPLSSLDRGVSDATSNLAADLGQNNPTGNIAIDAKDAVKMLRYEHPDYKTKKESWRKYQDLYDSNDLYRFIKKHLRESDPAWEDRVAKAFYFNYCKSIVDLIVDYIYHPPVHRNFKSEEEWIKNLHLDIDGSKTSYQAMMHKASTYAGVMGHTLAVIDMPTVDRAEILSQQDEKDKGIRPYVTLFTADQLLDWHLDEFNNFDWVKFRLYKSRENRTWLDPHDPIETYIIWTRTSWEKWEVTVDYRTPDDIDKAKAIQVGGGINPLNEVPVVPIRAGTMYSHPWFGSSTLTDIADINVAILNWSTLGNDEIYERCLNILAMEKSGTGDSTEALVSHHNVLEYEPGTKAPQYLQPGENPLTLIKLWIDMAKEEIYRLAKLGGSVGQKSMKHATSGIAYAFEFNETNQSLQSRALALEEAEKRIHHFLFKWRGQEFDGVIEYTKEFGVEDFLADLEAILKMKEVVDSETAVKTAQKKLIRRALAAESSEVIEKVLAEIEAAKDILRPTPSFEQTKELTQSDNKDGEQPSGQAGGKGKPKDTKA